MLNISKCILLFLILALFFGCKKNSPAASTTSNNNNNSTATSYYGILCVSKTETVYNDTLYLPAVSARAYFSNTAVPNTNLSTFTTVDSVSLNGTQLSF